MIDLSFVSEITFFLDNGWMHVCYFSLFPPFLVTTSVFLNCDITNFWQTYLFNGLIFILYHSK